MLESRHLSFCYQGQKHNIFSDISITVKPAEVLAVLGPNGVGKSTFLRTLIGYEKAAAGGSYLGGNALGRLSYKDIAQKIAYIPQQSNVSFAFLVRTIIEMGISPHLSTFETPDASTGEEVENAARLLKISHLLDKPINEISGGEQQLVYIARALLQKTQFIIMDEPTAHLDFANQARFLTLVSHLSKNGIALIFSTHIPDHAYSVADKVLLLQPNDHHFYGTAQEVMTNENLSNAYQIDIESFDYKNRHLIIVGNEAR